MTQQDLQRQVKKAQFHAVYFFYGKEDFLLERAARKLAKDALGEGDPSFNYHVFWGTDFKNADEIINAANAYPFMSAKRVVLVREADPILKDKKLLDYASNPNPDTVLILTASAPAKKSKSSKAKARVNTTDLFSYLQSRSNAMGEDVTLEFKELRDAALLGWIEREFETRGVHIDQKAAIALQELKGNTTGEIASEIEKVVTALPGKQHIEETDITELLGASRQFDVFQLSQAVLSRDGKFAQEILLRLLKSDPPGRIIFQLSQDLSILWQLRNAPASRQSTNEEAYRFGLKGGWQLDKIRMHVSKFPSEEYFDRCFEDILEADAALKTGSGWNSDVIMSTLIHRLTAHPPCI